MGITKFDLLYCEDLLVHMSKGKSYATFGAEIKVTLSTMKRWEKHIPEWANAKELGMLCQMSKWEDIVLQQSDGTIKGAPATTIFALKNFFPDQFKENTALIGKEGLTIVIDTGVPTALPDVEGQIVPKHLDHDEVGAGKISENALTLNKQALPYESFLDEPVIEDAEIVVNPIGSKGEDVKDSDNESEPWDL